MEPANASSTQSAEIRFKEFCDKLLEAEQYDPTSRDVFTLKVLDDVLKRYCNIIAEELHAQSCTVQLKVHSLEELKRGNPKGDGVAIVKQLPREPHVRKHEESHGPQPSVSSGATVEQRKQRNNSPRRIRDNIWNTSLSFPYAYYPKGAAVLVAWNETSPWGARRADVDAPSLIDRITPLQSGVTADILQDRSARVRDPLSIRTTRGMRKLGGGDHRVWTGQTLHNLFYNYYGVPIRIHANGDAVGLLKVENKGIWSDPRLKASDVTNPATVLSQMRSPACKSPVTEWLGRLEQEVKLRDEGADTLQSQLSAFLNEAVLSPEAPFPPFLLKPLRPSSEVPDLLVEATEELGSQFVGGLEAYRAGLEQDPDFRKRVTAGEPLLRWLAATFRRFLQEALSDAGPDSDGTPPKASATPDGTAEPNEELASLLMGWCRGQWSGKPQPPLSRELETFINHQFRSLAANDRSKHRLLTSQSRQWDDALCTALKKSFLVILEVAGESGTFGGRTSRFSTPGWQLGEVFHRLKRLILECAFREQLPVSLTAAMSPEPGPAEPSSGGETSAFVKPALDPWDARTVDSLCKELSSLEIRKVEGKNGEPVFERQTRSFFSLAYLKADLACLPSREDFVAAPYPREAVRPGSSAKVSLSDLARLAQEQSYRKSLVPQDYDEHPPLQILFRSLEEEWRMIHLLCCENRAYQEEEILKEVDAFMKTISSSLLGPSAGDLDPTDSKEIAELIEKAFEKAKNEHGLPGQLALQGVAGACPDAPRFCWRVRLTYPAWDEGCDIYLVVLPSRKQLQSTEALKVARNWMHGYTIKDNEADDNALKGRWLGLRDLNADYSVEAAASPPAEFAERTAQFEGELATLHRGGQAEAQCNRLLHFASDRTAARLQALAFALGLRNFDVEDAMKLSWAAVQIGKLIERHISYRGNHLHPAVPLTALEFTNLPISSLGFVDDLREQFKEAERVNEELVHHLHNELVRRSFEKTVSLTPRIKEFRSYFERLGERHPRYEFAISTVWLYLLAQRLTEHLSEEEWKEVTGKVKAAAARDHRDDERFITALRDLPGAVSNLAETLEGVNVGESASSPRQDQPLRHALKSIQEFLKKSRRMLLLADRAFEAAAFETKDLTQELLNHAKGLLLKNVRDEGFLKQESFAWLSTGVSNLSIQGNDKGDWLPDGDQSEQQFAHAKELAALVYRQYDSYAQHSSSLLVQILNRITCASAASSPDYFSFHNSVRLLLEKFADYGRALESTGDVWQKYRDIIQTLRSYVRGHESDAFCRLIDTHFSSRIGNERKAEERGGYAYLGIGGMYKRARMALNVLWIQRPPKQLGWELHKADYVGARLDCLFKNQVFATYESVWRLCDPFMEVVREDRKGRDNLRRQRLLGLRAVQFSEGVYQAIQVTALMDSDATDEDHWEYGVYSLTRLSQYLTLMYRTFARDSWEEYCSRTKEREAYRNQYIEWFRLVDNLLKRKQLREGLDGDSVNRVRWFGTYVGETAMDRLIGLIDTASRLPDWDMRKEFAQVIFKKCVEFDLVGTLDDLVSAGRDYGDKTRGAWTFSADELIDIGSLANRLQSPRRMFDIWLASQLSAPTKDALKDYQQVPRSNLEPLQQALLQDVNGVVRGVCIYEEQRFSGITLERATETLKNENPRGRKLERLNRLLMEAAYPSEVSRIQAETEPAWLASISESMNRRVARCGDAFAEAVRFVISAIRSQYREADPKDGATPLEATDIQRACRAFVDRDASAIAHEKKEQEHFQPSTESRLPRMYLEETKAKELKLWLKGLRGWVEADPDLGKNPADGRQWAWLMRLRELLVDIQRSQSDFLTQRLADLREEQNVKDRIMNYVLLYKNTPVAEGHASRTEESGTTAHAATDRQQGDEVAGQATAKPSENWNSYDLFYYVRQLVPVEIQIRTQIASTMAEQYHNPVYKARPPKGTELQKARMERIGQRLDEFDKEMDVVIEDYVNNSLDEDPA